MPSRVLPTRRGALERQRVAGAALIPVGRDDGDFGQIGQAERKGGQAIGLIAIVIGKQETHCSAAGAVKP